MSSWNMCFIYKLNLNMEKSTHGIYIIMATQTFCIQSILSILLKYNFQFLFLIVLVFLHYLPLYSLSIFFKKLLSIKYFWILLSQKFSAQGHPFCCSSKNYCSPGLSPSFYPGTLYCFCSIFLLFLIPIYFCSRICSSNLPRNGMCRVNFLDTHKNIFILKFNC